MRRFSGVRAVPAILVLAAAPGLPAAWADEPPRPVLDRVVLSTAGLGQFDWTAEVAGNADLALTVDLHQVDDLLKSLVVFDGAGRLGGVSLPGRAPLEQAFRTLPFGPEALDDPAALLTALRGAEIELSGRRELRGRLLSVTVDSDGHGEAPRRHRLTLMTDDGLAQAVLEEATALRFPDPAVAARIGEGLAAVQQHRAQDARTLTVALEADDAAPRRVGLSYVVEAPVWKAAYRLVLSGADAGEALLQGWAVVENATGGDWQQVELALISGNPVTWRQSLYDSYYVPRPELPVQVVESVTPRRDDGAMAERLSAAMLPAPRASFAPVAELAGDAAFAPPAAPAGLAEADEGAVQITFRFAGRFDLPAGHTLLAPFVSTDLAAEPVWLYQPDTHASHPLAAVALDNDSGATLPPGILTLYEGGGADYAGDAAMPLLPAGDSRLITFALDRATRIERRSPEATQLLEQVRLERGVLIARREHRQTTDYLLQAPPDRPRTLLIDHPLRSGWALAVPDDVTVSETTGHHRLRLELAAGETRRLAVVESRLDSERVVLGDLSADRLAAWASASGPLDDGLRAALEGLADQRRALAEAEAALTRTGGALEDLHREQERLRANLAAVPGDSDLARRYLADMAAQEDRIAELRADRERQQDALERQRRAFADALANLGG